MLRSIAVTAATVAGLWATLGYTPATEQDAVALGDAGADPTAGLTAPVETADEPGPSAPTTSAAAPAQSADLTDSGTPTPDPSRTGTPSPRSSTASPDPDRPGGGAPTGSPVPRDAPRASMSPRPTASASPRPSAPSTGASPTPSTSSTGASPTPSPSIASPEPEPIDYVGPAVSHVHGTVQVAVRIRGDLIVDAWALQYPTTGEALAINQEAIPRLRARTISAQSASFATVSGATLTSNAWKDSLQAALLEAGW